MWAAIARERSVISRAGCGRRWVSVNLFFVIDVMHGVLALERRGRHSP
jgi:hypothetical protein